MKNEREMFEKTIVDKCGFNPETSFELSSVTGDYKSDVVYFAWIMWQASANREGYKLVPTTPKNEMIVAIENKVQEQLDASAITADMFRLDGERIFEAMINAID